MQTYYSIRSITASINLLASKDLEARIPAHAPENFFLLRLAIVILKEQFHSGKQAWMGANLGGISPASGAKSPVSWIDGNVPSLAAYCEAFILQFCTST